jgi:Tfp pilus assembly protein PilX
MRPMKATNPKQIEARPVHKSPGSERGIVLPVVLILIAVVAVMGSAAVVMTRADIKTTSNYKNSQEAFFIAQAGTEHARAVLGIMNAASADKTSFSDELASVVGGNGTLDGHAGTTDDAAIANTAFGPGSYTVYLTNDSLDGTSNQTDTNKRVTLTSIGRGPNGSEAIIELTVSTFQLFPPPAAITLLGPGASFSGGSSTAKQLHGDDQCGTDPLGTTRPVLAMSDAADVSAVQNSVNSTKPKTYYAKNEIGATVTAAERPDLISAAIPSSTLLSIQTAYGIDLLSATELNGFVEYLKKVGDTVASGGASSNTVNIGTPANPKVVVVTGNFSLNGNGAGILVVTGELVFNGTIDYEGLILVIGQGSMRRSGAGNGTLSGAIVVANTLGPDGVAGTSDDVLGPPKFDTSGAGYSNVNYCSTAINQALSVIIPRPVAFKHLL